MGCRYKYRHLYYFDVFRHLLSQGLRQQEGGSDISHHIARHFLHRFEHATHVVELTAAAA